MKCAGEGVSLAALRSLAVAVLYRILTEDAVSILVSLLAMGIVEPQNSRGPVATLNCQKLGGLNYHHGLQIQNGSQRWLTYRDL